jgi:hypothetical protein
MELDLRNYLVDQYTQLLMLLISKMKFFPLGNIFNASPKFANKVRRLPLKGQGGPYCALLELDSPLLANIKVKLARKTLKGDTHRSFLPQHL